MRVKLLILLSILLVAASAGLSGAVVLASTGPLHAGDALFPLQELAERGAASLKFVPARAADYQLQLLERRTTDFSERIGTPDELPTLERLWKQLDLTVTRLTGLTGLAVDRAQQLRERLLIDLRTIQAALNLSEVAAEQSPDQVGQFSRRLDELITIAGDGARPLSALNELVSPTTQSAQPALRAAAAVSNSRADGNISPHIVRFQPGSLGAMHAFFPLEGQHAEIDCGECHSGGRYAGTPNTCAGCHAGDAPVLHYPGVCSLCHTTSAWKPATFDHKAFDTSDCQACHKRDKPAEHWNGVCSACHSTNAWKPAHFDHAVAGATDCQFCHGKDKPANHWSAQCSACHSTRGWLPASFNHAVAGATDCKSCHNGDAPANHWSAQCSACHDTNGWKGASFNHGAVGATDCKSCHDGDKPAGHWSVQCSACHDTGGWKGASFNHGAVGATDCQSCHNPPKNHFSGQCSQCHDTGGWGGASFNHSFPMNHGGANGRCDACHIGGGTDWTCFGCHNEAEIDKKHTEKGIADYARRCPDCHSGGGGGGGGDD